MELELCKVLIISIGQGRLRDGLRLNSRQSFPGNDAQRPILVGEEKVLLKQPPMMCHIAGQGQKRSL